MRVARTRRPPQTEKRHHFLWRFWPGLPGLGGMTRVRPLLVGRVLVERVEGFATPEEWERAYADDRGLRADVLPSRVAMLVKFWLHVSDEEQLKRFEKRENNPLKSWKITDDDWRNREKRAAVPRGGRGHARARRNTPHVAAGSSWRRDSKRYARVKVVETVIAEIERGMRERGFPPLPV